MGAYSINRLEGLVLVSCLEILPSDVKINNHSKRRKKMIDSFTDTHLYNTLNIKPYYMYIFCIHCTCTVFMKFLFQFVDNFVHKPRVQCVCMHTSM